MKSAPHWYFCFILNNLNHEGQLVIYIKARLCCAMLPLECLNTPEVLLQICSSDHVTFMCSSEGLLVRSRMRGNAGTDLITDYLHSELTLPNA